MNNTTIKGKNDDKNWGGWVMKNHTVFQNTLHIATGEFCFAEVPFEGTGDEAVLEAKRLQLIAGNPGLPDKEFNEILDEYLKTGKIANGGDFYEELNTIQKIVLNEVKKSKKRTN